MEKKYFWHASTLFNWKWQIGRLSIVANMNKGDGLMGRLGGGWAWKLSILASRRCVVFELFVMSIRIQWNKKTVPSVTDAAETAI